jgi:hypothetical protein
MPWRTLDVPDRHGDRAGFSFALPAYASYSRRFKAGRYAAELRGRPREDRAGCGTKERQQDMMKLSASLVQLRS